MNDGYYYFHSIEDKHASDKSLGYVCIRKTAQSSEFFIQCSLNRDKICSLVNGNVLDIYISPTQYITNGSHLISRLPFHSKNKLFVDVQIPELFLDFSDNSQYVIITSNNRTILYSEIYKKVAAIDNILLNKNNQNCIATEELQTYKTHINEIFFDPFNTTNTSYEWKIISPFMSNKTENISNQKADSKIFENGKPLSSNDIAKYLENLNIAYDYFGRMAPNNFGLTPDVFLKMAFSAYRISGHLLIGKYTDSSSNKIFNIIGLPGINALSNIKRKRKKKQIIPPLQIFARWMFAINKPENSFQSNFNGYWLYYFNSESGSPVKPVIMT